MRLFVIYCQSCRHNGTSTTSGFSLTAASRSPGTEDTGDNRSTSAVDVAGGKDMEELPVVVGSPPPTSPTGSQFEDAVVEGESSEEFCLWAYEEPLSYTYTSETPSKLNISLPPIEEGSGTYNLLLLCERTCVCNDC